MHAAVIGNSKSRWRRRLFGLAVALVVCYLVFCMIMRGCANKLLLFPSREPIDTEALPRTIHTTVGEMQLFTIDTDPEAGEPQAYVIGYTGNGSRAEHDVFHFDRYFRRHPVRLFVMNYPGFGESDGPAKLASIPPAALGVYDAVAKEAAGKPIFVVGHSLGTTVALCVARSRPVAGLILHNPPPLRQIIVGRYGWWNLWLGAYAVASAVPSEMESLDNEKFVTAPAIFLLAGRDTLVTPPYQKMVADAFRGPKQLIQLPEYGHNDFIDADDLPRVLDAVDWMWDQSLPANADAR